MTARLLGADVLCAPSLRGESFGMVVLEGMALSFTAIFEWSLREGRTRVTVPRNQRGRARLRASLGTVVYAAVFASAFISAPVALALAGITAVYYVFAPLPHNEVQELTAGP